MILEDAERAYRNDVAFHNVVDTIAQWIREMHVTPAEARAAAMLAAIKVEYEKPPSSVLAMCSDCPPVGFGLAVRCDHCPRQGGGL